MRHAAQLISALGIAVLLFFTPIVQTVYSDVTDSHHKRGQERKKTIVQLVVTNNLGGENRITSREISTRNAESIFKQLQRLEQALLHKDEPRARRITSSLKERGVFEDDSIFALIHRCCTQTKFGQHLFSDGPAGLINAFCLLLGAGEGLFYYTFDLLVLASGFILLFPFYFFSSLIVYLGLALYLGLYMPISHSIPRVTMPLAHYLHPSNLTTIGMKGTKTIPSLYEGNIVGFNGLIVNMMSLRRNPRYFCLGSALAVFGHR